MIEGEKYRIIYRSGSKEMFAEGDIVTRNQHFIEINDWKDGIIGININEIVSYRRIANQDRSAE